MSTSRPTMPAGCWQLDVSSGTLQLCPHSRRMFGLSPDSPGTLSESQWSTRLHPPDLASVRNALTACLDRQAPYAARFRTIHTDGSLQPLFGVGQPIHGKDGSRFVGWNFDLKSAGELASDWIARRPDALASEHLFSLVPEAELAPDPHPVPPEPLLERAHWILRVRRSREGLFGRAIMGEPAFDLLLRLYVQSEQKGVSLTSLARPAGIPYSSASRWIDYLAGKGFVERTRSQSDRRSSTVQLTPQGRAVMDELLAIR